MNFFFYSLISIVIYKLICHETNNYSDFIYYCKTWNIHFSYFDFLNIYFFDRNNYLFSFFDFFFYQKQTPFFYFLFHSNGFVDSYNFSSFYYLNDESLINKYGDLVYLSFFIRGSNLNLLYCFSLQKMLLVHLNETSLFFFRFYNPTHFKLELITLYIIFPNDMALYVNKVQCFCFNVIYLYPLEIIDLPVLIYILPYIPYLFLFNFSLVNNLVIYYIVFLN